MWIVVIGALLIGITLGLLGSGGSILTVPVLRYLLGHEDKSAFAESLAIVGIIALFAALPYIKLKQVDWKAVCWFGIPGMFGAYVGAWLAGFVNDSVQMAVFAIVMMVAFYSMLFSGKNKKSAEPATKSHTKKILDSRSLVVALEGTLIGALTGFVGVGGGFMIVPALLLLVKLPIKTAMGTSLMIIAIKSVTGIVKYSEYQDVNIDWWIVFWFSLIGAIASFVGQSFNQRLNQAILQQVFAWFLLAMAIFVMVRELPGVWQSIN